MDEPKYAFWVKNSDGTERLTNMVFTLAEAEKKWPGRCRPDEDSKSTEGLSLGIARAGGGAKKG